MELAVDHNTLAAEEHAARLGMEDDRLVVILLPVPAEGGGVHVVHDLDGLAIACRQIRFGGRTVHHRAGQRHDPVVDGAHHGEADDLDASSVGLVRESGIDDIGDVIGRDELGTDPGTAADGSALGHQLLQHQRALVVHAPSCRRSV